MIWDTLAFDLDDMRYSCSGVAGLHRYYWGGKKAEYFERLRWECPLRYEEGLSIFADKLYQGNLAFEVRRAMPLWFPNKQSCRGSGSRDSKSGASSIFYKAILLGVWLLRF
ncbi:hypothetical protein ACFX2J_037519 [Malus domestica]